MSVNGGGNGDSPKALGAIVGVVAVIAGVYAMVNPMNLRIATLESNITKLEAVYNQAIERERKYIANGSELSDHVKANENKILSLEDWSKWWRRKYPVLNAKQDEKIKRLEWLVYGQGASEMFQNKFGGGSYIPQECDEDNESGNEGE